MTATGYTCRLWLVAIVLVGLVGVSSAAAEVPWEASPYNWPNSPYNFENSPNNFANSIKNFQNAEGRRGRLNIVNSLGVVTGYAIVKRDGGINYFDSDGDRIGYSVDGGKTQYGPSGEEASFTVSVQE